MVDFKVKTKTEGNCVRSEVLVTITETEGKNKIKRKENTNRYFF